jgi:hypothetical protein
MSPAKIYFGLHVCSIFLTDFKQIWIFSKEINKVNKISQKIHLAGAELIHADRRTYGQTKPIGALSDTRRRLETKEEKEDCNNTEHNRTTETRIKQNW